MRRGDGVNLKDGKYQYRFEGAKINGKRHQIVKGGFATRAEAVAARAKAMAEYEASGSIFKPSEISVSDYLDQWLKEEVINKMKATTVKNYQKEIRLYIKPAIGHYKLRALSHSALQKLLDDLYNKGFSRNTLSVISGILNSSLDHAVEPLKYIKSNPMQHVKLPSKRAESGVESRSKPHVYITKEQMARIFERFPQGSSAYIPLMLGYKCGLRLGEAYAITWDDVDFENKTLSVNKQVQWKSNGNHSGNWYFSAPKYNSYRTIAIDDQLVEALKNEKSRQERKAAAYFDDEYTRYYESKGTRTISTDSSGKEIRFVMIRDDGTYIQPRTMQHASYIIHTKLSFPDFDFHSLRHTHCTMLLENDAKPKYVQERLGHKNISVTLEIYQHLTNSMKKEGDDILNKMFGGDPSES